MILSYAPFATSHFEYPSVIIAVRTLSTSQRDRYDEHSISKNRSLRAAAHQIPAIDYLANILTNELIELPGKLVLALDDFHRIEGHAVPDFVSRPTRSSPPRKVSPPDV